MNMIFAIGRVVRRISAEWTRSNLTSPLEKMRKMRVGIRRNDTICDANYVMLVVPRTSRRVPTPRLLLTPLTVA